MFHHPHFQKMPKDSELKRNFRNFKLSFLTDDLKFKINPSLVSFDKMNFIANNFHNSIITGSIALIMYGLLTRDASDIDIIINDRDLYPSYNKDLYDDEIKNRLGYRNFNYKNGFFSKKQTYKVDFFENDNVSYTEFLFNGELFKVQNIIEIIDQKLNMALSNSINSNKHYSDLQTLFYNANLMTVSS
jgi:hypothetical protein